MNFKYSIEEDNEWIDIIVEPNEHITGFIHHIDGWLVSDVQCFAEEDYIPRVKEIMESDNPDEEEWFEKNAYSVCVHKDYTKITYIFEEDNPHMVPCTLPTPMLYEILKIWAKAKKEHDLKKAKQYGKR